MVADAIGGIADIPNKRTELLGILITISLHLTHFVKPETGSIHTVFLCHYISGTECFGRYLLAGITSIMGIHRSTGQFPVDGMERSNLIHPVPYIDRALSWDILCLHPFRQIVCDPYRHIRICQESPHERFHIFWLWRNWRLHADLADIIRLSDVRSLHDDTVFFIILCDQETVAMHSCTQGIAFLLHFFKCHHLPDLRILAVDRTDVRGTYPDSGCRAGGGLVFSEACTAP